MTRANVVGSIAAVLASFACDDSGNAVPETSTSRFTEVDSAQVVIRTTHWSAAHAQSARAIVPEPTLLLGSDTLPGQAFFRVRGAVTTDDGGGVAVLDAGSGELRFFDGGGDFLGAYGGYGEGPAAVWGETAVTYGGESELRQHAIDGTLAASVRVEGLRVELTPEIVERVAREHPSDPQRQGFYRDLYSAMPLPDSLPLYSELVTGSGPICCSPGRGMSSCCIPTPWTWSKSAGTSSGLAI